MSEDLIYKKEEQELVTQVNKGSVKAFEMIFKTYYVELSRFAVKYVGSTEQAEEIVQELFLTIWENREKLSITSSLKSYLYTSIKNRSLNYLKSAAVKYIQRQEEVSVHNHPVSLDVEEYINYNELQHTIQKAVEKLPEKCRIIFTLSRQAGLSYQEIANELNLSIKTVEAQMGIALKRIRGDLSERN